MARIRTIKPEFWTSGQIMECSPITRLLFIGLWNFADDKGRMTANPKKIRAQIFPADDVTTENINMMLSELSKNDLITLYECENIEYLQIDGWSRHQRIDKPQPSRLPNIDGIIEEHSTINPRAISGQFKSARRRNGMEGKGS